MIRQFIHTVHQLIHAIQKFLDTILNIVLRLFRICQHFQKISIRHLTAVQFEGL